MLRSKQDRQEWETSFNQHYLQPVVSNLQQEVSHAMNSAINDTAEGTYNLEEFNYTMFKIINPGHASTVKLQLVILSDPD